VGDFPGVEIVPSDLDFALHPLYFRTTKRAPGRENSSDAAHMSDRSSTYLSYNTWIHGDDLIQFWLPPTNTLPDENQIGYTQISAGEGYFHNRMGLVFYA
jgi:hypothetical protein